MLVYEFVPNKTLEYHLYGKAVSSISLVLHLYTSILKGMPEAQVFMLQGAPFPDMGWLV